MKNLHARLLSFLLLVLLLPALSIAAEGQDANRPHWNNIDVILENVEPARAHFLPFADRETAVQGDPAASDFFLSLNGTWKFHYSESPVNVLTNPATCPTAGIPELKVSAVNIRKV